jgi:hypothetical protein
MSELVNQLTYEGITIPEPLSEAEHPDTEFEEQYRQYVSWSSRSPDRLTLLTLGEYAQSMRWIVLPLRIFLNVWKEVKAGEYGSELLIPEGLQPKVQSHVEQMLQERAREA